MKTIAIFSGYFLPHTGGIENYTANFSKELEKLGYRVLIITVNENNYESIKEDKNILLLRLPIYNFFKNRYPIPKKNKKYKEILSVLDKEKPDAIIVNTRFHLTSMIGAKYGKKNNIKVFLIEHGSEYVTINNKILDFFGHIYEHIITKIIKKYVYKFYGVSKAASSWLKNFKIDSSGEWYNSINYVDIPKHSNSKEITFAYIGRVIKQKGIENILLAFAKLQKKHKNIKLYIAGDGDMLEEIKEKYSNYKNIFILGRINRKEVFELLSYTDVFLYPPLWPEGLPTSVLEAGIMKCAVIGTDQGGIKEIIVDNTNGIIVKETSKSLYLAMEKLIKDNSLRLILSDNLSETINNSFLWENNVKKIVSDIKGE